ncbi:hypothetical protein B0I35DRAFT_474337 [Stachybotrys elegans]|uniref:AAA+ ATPase domain-containing protein n=1 Tax=Stachybotrys elegans TaxID=80388 RepID=A0A8K0WUE7_9HYPO|nr:hypothetical protein B0I35DRAFT_474337 [Stachybotrys elegans]
MTDQQVEESAEKLDEPLPSSDNEAVFGDSNGDDGRDGHKAKPMAPSTVVDEIQALKERLQLLEQQCSDAPNVDPGGTQHARKWVLETEAGAERTAAERAYFGKGKDDVLVNEGHVFKYQNRAYIIRDKNKRDRVFFTPQERDEWVAMHKAPAEGLRIPTSLRPVDTVKLGPRTQWDESDSSAWDSDESTRTRDFDYFQARLRGDFEWEVDRLRLQRKRYYEFKKKKQLKEELKRWTARAGQVPVDDADGGGDGTGENSDSAPMKLRAEGGVPRLLVLDWDDFTAAMLSPSVSFSAVVIILKGEPKVSTSVPFLQRLFKPPVARSTADKDRAQPDYDGHTPLPERICLFSQPLVRMLSELHGSDISPGDDLQRQNPSVVLLRPYRLLTLHDKGIRKMHETITDHIAELKVALPEDRGLAAVPTAVPTTPASSTSVASVPDLGGGGGPSVGPPALAENSETGAALHNYNKAKLDLQHLSCLVSFMDTYLVKRITWLQSVHCDKIYFSDIWHLYKPGEFVVSADGKQAYQIAAVNTGQHIGKDPYGAFSNTKKDNDADDDDKNAIISCVYIDYDGTLLGPVVREFVVTKFDGERSLATLDVLPLRHHVVNMPEVARRLAKLEGDAQARGVEAEMEAFREQLVRRGRKFVSAAGVKHMDYTGLTADKRDEIESQVMIDVQEAFAIEANEQLRPSFSRVSGAYQQNSSGANMCNSECCIGQNIHDDADVQAKVHEGFVASKLEELGSTDIVQPPVSLVARNIDEVKANGTLLSSDDFMIMSYSVFGFVLRNRSWAKLDLGFLSDIKKPEESAEPRADGDGNQKGGRDQYTKDSDQDRAEDASDDSDGGGADGLDKTAFSQLVLPAGHKKMVLSLVSQHFRNKESFKRRNEKVDIVKGKGKGLIILLHGAPGVGKTTTAEGVAETFGKPLFQITCGDLGTTAAEVEESLQRNFALASRWDCILLLDEADVFLAARRRDDFTRNGLVAVFLRVLEYYAGILFLTTNRVGDLDEAFTSRIHMTLYYPQLDRVSTAKICRLNLNMIRDRYKAAGRRIKVDQDEIEDHIREYWDHHPKARWNGRQIRNACQTALALAEYDTQPNNKKHDLAVQTDARVHLKVRHVKRVSKAYLSFIEYLRSVHGTDSETRATELGLRALERIMEQAAMNTGESFGERLRQRDGSFRGGREAASQHKYSFREKFRPDLGSGPQQQEQRQQHSYQPPLQDPYASFAPQRHLTPYNQYGPPPTADSQPRAAAAAAAAPPGFTTNQEYATASGSPQPGSVRAYGQPREHQPEHNTRGYGTYPSQGNVPDNSMAHSPGSY